MSDISARLATELNAQQQQVVAATKLLDEGATVPFIARYRKEITGGLDDTQLRLLEQRLSYLRELEERRGFILSTIESQNKLTAELSADIASAQSKTELEDLYLPYKAKRRTKGQIAIEAGLEPLADTLFNDANLSPEQEAEQFVNAEKGIADTKAALDGAKFILMERFAEDAKLLAKFRSYTSQNGAIESSLIKGQEQAGAKYRDYFEHQEALKKVPSHRALAMLRARNEGILQLNVNPEPNSENSAQLCAQMIAERIQPNIAIVTDVTHDTTTPMIDAKKQGLVKIGDGPVIAYAPAVQQKLRDLITDTADKNKIPFQRAALSRATGTDTDAFAYSGSGVASALISLPLRYMHTTVEMVHRDDVENVIRLIYETLLTIKEGETFSYFD